MCSADDICSEYFYQNFKRKGTRVPRKRVYNKIHISQPHLWTMFEKLAELCTTYNIDHMKYIEFCFRADSNVHVKSPKDLLNIASFRKYAQSGKIEELYKKIYDNVNKTCDYIAEECIRLDLEGAKAYIKYLVKTDQLATQFMLGNISRHWLSAINKLDQIVNMMPEISRGTLYKIVKNRLIYFDELQETFRYYTGKRCRPFYLTDLKIEKILDKRLPIIVY